MKNYLWNHILPLDIQFLSLFQSPAGVLILVQLHKKSLFPEGQSFRTVKLIPCLVLHIQIVLSGTKLSHGCFFYLRLLRLNGFFLLFFQQVKLYCVFLGFWFCEFLLSEYVLELLFIFDELIVLVELAFLILDLAMTFIGKTIFIRQIEICQIIIFYENLLCGGFFFIIMLRALLAIFLIFQKRGKFIIVILELSIQLFEFDRLFLLVVGCGFLLHW